MPDNLLLPKFHPHFAVRLVLIGNTTTIVIATATITMVIIDGGGIAHVNSGAICRNPQRHQLTDKVIYNEEIKGKPTIIEFNSKKKLFKKCMCISKMKRANRSLQELLPYTYMYVRRRR